LPSAPAGAAQAASAYRGPNGKADWYLPSLNEVMLMYQFAEQSGKVNRTSTTSGVRRKAAPDHLNQPFDFGALYEYNKDGLLRPSERFRTGAVNLDRSSGPAHNPAHPGPWRSQRVDAVFLLIDIQQVNIGKLSAYWILPALAGATLRG
jgi:hypothetical protein